MREIFEKNDLLLLSNDYEEIIKTKNNKNYYLETLKFFIKELFIFILIKLINKKKIKSYNFLLLYLIRIHHHKI